MGSMAETLENSTFSYVLIHCPRRQQQVGVGRSNRDVSISVNTSKKRREESTPSSADYALAVSLCTKDHINVYKPAKIVAC